MKGKSLFLGAVLHLILLGRFAISPQAQQASQMAVADELFKAQK
jgi:hypothetical protein